MKPAQACASCGLSFHCPEDIASKLTVATEAGYDFVAVPIVNPRYRMPEAVAKPSLLPPPQETRPDSNSISENSVGKDDSIRRGYAFTRSDMLLSSTDWSTLIVGLVSKDLNLESRDQHVRRTAELRLKRELDFAAHLGLAAIMLPLRQPNNCNLSRILYSRMNRGGSTQLWIKVPLQSKVLASNGLGDNGAGSNGDCGDDTGSSVIKAVDGDTWEWWDALRGCADFEKRLFLALTIDSMVQPDERRLQRWLGEPVKCLVLSTSLFLTNKRGCPVLPRVVQATVRRFMPLKVQYIIEGRNVGHDVRLYQQYMDHLIQQQSEEKVDPLKQYAQGYEDFLQSPLQPLMDNLESGTYEVFEKDPIKYAEYQKAILRALQDRVSDSEAPNRTIIVMVLGAGRGPLVKAALLAADTSERKIMVYAVEKNPNAIVTLLTNKEEIWGDQVEVVSSDMREWRPMLNGQEVKADIIVSELLGSFGDNELSPECLYDAERLFKPDAVSIPCSYTSWIGPIQSSKLFQEVRASVDIDKNPSAHFETPYVVHFQNRTELAPPVPLFTFEHPSRGPVDVNRYEVKKFDVNVSSVLHGFAGYFECVLYKEVSISINPQSHSKGMFSWFPIFFPLKTPVKLRQGDEVELHFWRINNDKRVWYEWCITKPVPVPVHNPNGRSHEIGL